MTLDAPRTPIAIFANMPAMDIATSLLPFLSLPTGHVPLNGLLPGIAPIAVSADSFGRGRVGRAQAQARLR